MQHAASWAADDPFSIVEWDPERFGVGIRQIDAQHRHLLSIINHICRLKSTLEHDPGALTPVARKRGGVTDRYLEPQLQRGGELAPHIDELVTYCAKHLAAEELLLETHGYSERVTHAAEHDTLVQEVGRAHRLCEEGNMEMADLRRLVAFLRQWMASHIPKDRRFAPLLLDKGYGA
uniref:Hemerythrin-like domain-containing protein n=1 Tax=Neobodo designis TaxID=312471 RepID=A0A7S1W1W9_NEODS|eukprot:CAMPEP_0174855956 /NCGR_PEP_ID=MMETSP1114-20130205/34677_1 /TAXON_ID=312471 /ORGANISM="Neobodo designis, Strain CCAP 1951/1" /LENGTH=176 /DNA_ID=CAMNT_0016090731 /DNA_START=33 /DNA_END=563 /DNA_ORIENTATION=+